jgi:hypothetical protein
MRYIVIAMALIAPLANAGFWPNANEAALEAAQEATTCYDMAHQHSSLIGSSEPSGSYSFYVKKTDEAMALLEERGIIGKNMGSWIQAGQLTKGMTECEALWAIGTDPYDRTYINDRHSNWFYTDTYYKGNLSSLYLRFQDGVLYGITVRQ